MKKLQTVLLAALMLCVSGMLFASGGQDAAVEKDSETVKAGFIYIGPAGDFGWTYAHDRGRLYVEEKFPWLETVIVEIRSRR